MNLEKIFESVLRESRYNRTPFNPNEDVVNFKNIIAFKNKKCFNVCRVSKKGYLEPLYDEQWDNKNENHNPNCKLKNAINHYLAICNGYDGLSPRSSKLCIYIQDKYKIICNSTLTYNCDHYFNTG